MINFYPQCIKAQCQLVLHKSSFSFPTRKVEVPVAPYPPAPRESVNHNILNVFSLVSQIHRNSLGLGENEAKH